MQPPQQMEFFERWKGPLPKKTDRLKSMRAVFECRENSPEWASGIKFTSSHDVYDAFKYLAEETREHFLALHLDTKNHVICFDPVSIGSLNASIVHPREVFKSVLLSSAASIILIHNHPTGDPEPSSEDLAVTKRLKDGAELLGICLLDHIIIGTGKYVSFADKALL